MTKYCPTDQKLGTRHIIFTFAKVLHNFEGSWRSQMVSVEVSVELHGLSLLYEPTFNVPLLVRKWLCDTLSSILCNPTLQKVYQTWLFDRSSTEVIKLLPGTVTFWQPYWQHMQFLIQTNIADSPECVISAATTNEVFVFNEEFLVDNFWFSHSAANQVIYWCSCKNMFLNKISTVFPNINESLM